MTKFEEKLAEIICARCQGHFPSINGEEVLHKMALELMGTLNSISVEKTRAEIKRLKYRNTEAFDCGCDGTKCAGYDMACDDILSIIDTMQGNDNGWIKFIPSLNLPKERVSIAYDTHDDRGVRYAYGYFQFHNGTCTMFWKDGNDQPRSIKAEDIRYWMRVPVFDLQQNDTFKEDPVNKIWHDINEKPDFCERLQDGTHVTPLIIDSNYSHISARAAHRYTAETWKCHIGFETNREFKWAYESDLICLTHSVTKISDQEEPISNLPKED